MIIIDPDISPRYTSHMHCETLYLLLLRHMDLCCAFAWRGFRVDPGGMSLSASSRRGVLLAITSLS